MIVQDQSDVIAFLAATSAVANTGSSEHIETHISDVFLAGDRAYKLKRAIKLPYVDFSTPAIRKAACDKELELNQRTSPDIYIRVRRITRDGQGLVFDGSGELVDAVVEMKRFQQEHILDHMALKGELTTGIMSSLAREILNAHKLAPSVKESGTQNIRMVLDINSAGFRESKVFTGSEIDQLDRFFRTNLQKLGPILDQRSERSCIKRCHGDLHLRNICMFDGRPQLFDCIDFNDQLATVDVLYDLAFLAMDLWHRDLRDLANLVVNHYLDGSDEEDGFACMPYFVALRAAVRAHVLATQSEDPHVQNAGEKRREARSYYYLALASLEARPSRMIAIGGLSGSGKSTVASKIAAFVGTAPGARLIESDRTRKAMFKVEPMACLPDSAYAPGVSDKVYNLMSKRAAKLLKQGCCVVADAVYDLPERRQMIESAAGQANVPFDGIWLHAETDVLRYRVETRAKSASDATQGVLDMQLARDLGKVSWNKISTSRTIEQTISETRKVLEV